MTKTIIIGENTTTPAKKAIVFSHMLDVGGKNMKISSAYTRPRDWRNIELICRNYGWEGTDLMFAYDGDRNTGTLYLGNWNDGVVE